MAYVETLFYVQQQTSKEVWWEINERGHSTFAAAEEEFHTICARQPSNSYRVIVRQRVFTDTVLRLSRGKRKIDPR